MCSVSRWSPRTSWRLNTPRGRSASDELRVAGPGWALGPDGDHVAFHVDVDRVLADAGQVELDVEAVTLAPGVHQHGRGSGQGALRGEELLGEAVQLTERVGADQHCLHLRSGVVVLAGGADDPGGSVALAIDFL